MKITQCKYGHYYDKAYFTKCPHCYRKNGGRDEDIIIKDVKLTANLSDTNQVTKTQDKRESNRKNVKRWIGEAWDELEEILADEESEPEEKERQLLYDVAVRPFCGDRKASECAEGSG